MIMYNPSTKATRDLDISDYKKYVYSNATHIRVLPISRDGYSPLVEMYKNKKLVEYHCVRLANVEAIDLNATLPTPTKGGYFRVPKSWGRGV